MGLNVSGLCESDFGFLTPLEVELKICAEYLHCTHENFLALSRDEKLKWVLYEEKNRKREDYFIKKRLENTNKLNIK